jgi:hypothetical protein
MLIDRSGSGASESMRDGYLSVQISDMLVWQFPEFASTFRRDELLSLGARVHTFRDLTGSGVLRTSTPNRRGCMR